MSRSALAGSVCYLHNIVVAQRYREDSDEQLLYVFSAHRDETAFAVLVRRHGPMVLQVCRRVLEHEQDAEDAFQATFLVLARRPATLRNKTALASFLHGTAYRIALSSKRAAARRRRYEGQTPSRPPLDPADELSWREVRALLDEEIVRLPEKYRSVFILCCLENRSRAEAGQQLELKERTVLSRLAAARKRLSQRLARRGVGLTAVLAASTLAMQPAPALSPLFISTTIKAVLGEGTAGLISANVAGLVKSAASVTMLNKIKMVTVLLMTTTLLAGAGAWISSANRGALNAETPPSLPASHSQPPQAKNAEVPQHKKRDVVTVKGRVLGPDGKPIKGARLYSARLRAIWPLSGAIVASAQQSPTAADGRFHITLDRPAYHEYSYLIVYASGFGVDWIDLSLQERLKEERLKDVTFRLVKDVPITARVVNTEGRPVAGVSVSPAAVLAAENEKLDDFLNGWHKSMLSKIYTTPRHAPSSPRKRLFAPLDAISGAATTDKDGRFTLRGVGGERIVHVAIFGGGVARTTLYVITRPDFEAAPYNAVLQKDEVGRKFATSNRFLGLHSPMFTFVAESGKTIEGVVKDADSGKPLPGVRLATRDDVVAFSDSAGAYRLNDLPKRAEGYEVWVIPPEGSAYLSRSAHADDTVGFSKVRLDIELVKGAIVTGRVVDRRTGKPLRCALWSAPLPGNKFYDSKPGFKSDYSDEALEMDKDGRFRLATIPGKALLMARVAESHLKVLGQPVSEYRQAVPDPDHKNLFLKAAGGTWRIMTEYREELLSWYNTVKVIDIKENSETRVELSVDGGTTARIAVQDAEGKPLAGVWAEGLTDIWPKTFKLPEATASVYALNPEEPRTMAFYHPEKKLGGTATVRGNEKGPVFVKLAPVGKVSGRLLDEEGNPLEGVEVSIAPDMMIGYDLYRFAAPTGKAAHTDKDGRFHIEVIVPDLKFQLKLRHGSTFFVGEPRLVVKQVRPGETLDLGNVRVKLVR